MSTLLRWCSRCETNFTRTNWQLHGHNPAQIACTSRDCRRKAVGYSDSEYTPTPLCGEHLLNARRSGGRVTFVDGRVCRVCDGHGRVNAQEIRVDSPGGQWPRCPDCMGTGYDPTLRLPSSSQGNQTGERNRREGPGRLDSPAERRIREAEQRAARSQWFDREIAPLADRFPGRQTSGAQSQGAGQPPLPRTTPTPSQPRPGPRRGSQVPSGPSLAPGSSAADISAFERMSTRAHFRRAGRRKTKFLFQATLAILSGAVLGILFVLPILPDAGAELVIDIQKKVGAMFGK